MKLVLRQPSDIFLQFEHHALASSMKEERQNAYLQLIDRLLACESGEEIEILKAHPDLLDDGLVQMMLQIAADLTAQGNLDTSNLLMNIAGQRLGVYDNTLIQAQLKVEADRILQQGSQQYRNNQFKAALQSWQQGLSIYRKIGDRAEEGRTLDDIGSAYYKLSRYSQALEFYQQALEIAQEIGERVGESITLTNIGSVYKDLDHHSRALEMFEQALEIFQAIGDCNNEGITLDKIGSVYGDLGEHRKALEYLQHSLAIRREIGDRSGEGYTLNNIGVVYSHLGDYHQALECLQQSLTICRETDDPTGEAGRCTSIGQIYKCLGQYPQAIEFLQQGLRIFGEVDNRAGKGTTLNNIGGVYEEVGQYSQSLEFYQKALTIRREVGDREGEGDSLNNIGVVYDYLGQHFQALEFHKQALTLRTDIGDRRGQGTSLHNIGASYKDLNQYSKALEFYEQALTLRRAVGDRDGEAVTLNDMGSVYLSLDQYPKALEFYQQALAIAREVGNQKEVGRVLGNIGSTLLLSGNFVEAAKILLEAIETLEHLRTGLSDDDKVSIFEIFADAYRLLQQALIPQNKISEALEVSERGRARAFVELLVKRLSISSEEPLAISYPTLQEIRQTAQAQNSTLVEYSIINSKTLWIWVIKPIGEIVLSIVNLEPLWQQQNTSLPELVLQARQSLGVKEKVRGATPTTTQKTSQSIRYINEPLRQLHQYLIEPIASLLPTDPNAHVIFIPQGSLFLVPFPALQDKEGKFLIEHHTILTAPSIQTLELTRQQRQRLERIHESPGQSQDALVVGNPTMPTIPLTEPPQSLPQLEGAEAEAVAIASLLNTQAIIGDKGTKVYIEKLMPTARLIHLATHGLLDDIKQLRVPGAIALAASSNDNGFLTAGEIYEMKLNAELIVLSACSSGQGKITGDGVVGLSRCLFAAGVPSVIVSLWSVGDDSTQFLMSEFYQNLQNGMNKAQALRQAMLTTIADYSEEPQCWAAFTLLGEAE